MELNMDKSDLHLYSNSKYLLSCDQTGFDFTLQVNVRITTMDAELEFSFHPNTTGKQLFDQVCMLKRANPHNAPPDGPDYKSSDRRSCLLVLL